MQHPSSEYMTLQQAFAEFIHNAWPEYGLLTARKKTDESPNDYEARLQRAGEMYEHAKRPMLDAVYGGALGLLLWREGNDFVARVEPSDLPSRSFFPEKILLSDEPYLFDTDKLAKYNECILHMHRHDFLNWLGKYLHDEKAKNLAALHPEYVISELPKFDSDALQWGLLSTVGYVASVIANSNEAPEISMMAAIRKIWQALQKSNLSGFKKLNISKLIVKWENTEPSDFCIKEPTVEQVLSGDVNIACVPLIGNFATYHFRFSTDDVRRLWPRSDLQAPVTKLGESTVAGSGAPGRPTSMHLVRSEFESRKKMGTLNLASLKQQSKDLSDWLAKNYPSAPQLTEKTIENNIRSEYRLATQSPEIIISG
jgi:hypothetical protein